MFEGIRGKKRYQKNSTFLIETANVCFETEFAFRIYPGL